MTIAQSAANPAVPAVGAAERTAANKGLFWALFPVGIMLFSVIVNIAFIRAATSDPSFTPEERYYEKAVRWPEVMAAAEASARLGWTHGLAVTPGTAGTAAVTLTLADRTGAPVTGAAVTLEATANLAARDVQRPTLTETVPGRYTGVMTTRRSGLWQVAVKAVRGGDVFARAVTVELTPRPRGDGGR